MRRSEKLSNASLYLESDGGYMPRSTYRICGALPAALPRFGWEREFDRVLAGYSVAMPTQWREMDIATHACAIAMVEVVLRSFGVVPKRGDQKWLGKHRRLLKCRLAWRSTCTPAQHASKRPRDDPPGSRTCAAHCVLIAGAGYGSTLSFSVQFGSDSLSVAIVRVTGLIRLRIAITINR
jgi:hypothetical protein